MWIAFFQPFAADTGMWKGLRLVKDILTDVKGAAPSDGQDAGSDAARMESTALHMLKEVSETMLTRLFEDCQTFAAHGKTKTIFVFDLTLAKRCHRLAQKKRLSECLLSS